MTKLRAVQFNPPDLVRETSEICKAFKMLFNLRHCCIVTSVSPRCVSEAANHRNIRRENV